MKFLYTKLKAKDLKEQIGSTGEAEKGEQGIQGIQGEKGDTGAKGDTGNNGVDGVDANKEVIKDQNSGLDTKIWIGTQAEYELVLEKDSTTLYMVK